MLGNHDWKVNLLQTACFKMHQLAKILRDSRGSILTCDDVWHLQNGEKRAPLFAALFCRPLGPCFRWGSLGPLQYFCLTRTVTQIDRRETLCCLLLLTYALAQQSARGGCPCAVGRQIRNGVLLHWRGAAEPKHGLLGGGFLEQRRCTNMCKNPVYPWRWRILGALFLGDGLKSKSLGRCHFEPRFSGKFFLQTCWVPNREPFKQRFRWLKQSVPFSRWLNSGSIFIFFKICVKPWICWWFFTDCTMANHHEMTPPCAITFSDQFHIFMRTHEILEGQY